MGQAASMCRFRGCRYKKNKANKSNNNSPTATSTPAIAPASATTTATIPSASTNLIPATTGNGNIMGIEFATASIDAETESLTAGLHLRSIEEPSVQLQQFRMHTEQGGTGFGFDTSLLGTTTRTGVPLQIQQHPNHPHQYQIQQQQQMSPQGTATTATSTTATSTTTTSTTTTQNNAHPLYHHHHQYYNSHYSHLNHYNHNPLSPQHKGYDPEYARMESWMDENQEFVQDYFIRKATRQVVDAWLVSHATSAGNDVTTGSPTHPNGQNCSSRGGSGATTPVRKISAHEFERGGLLKPIVNTIDGTPTFLSISTQNDCSTNNSNNTNSTVNGGVGVCGNSIGNAGHHQNHHNHHHHNHHHHQTGNVGNHLNYHRPQRLSRMELKQLDEKELIFELVKDICNELEVRTLCHKILQNVSILLNADRGSLFLVQGRCNGTDGPKKCLVSKLFDVCPRSTVEEMEQQEEVRVAWGTGIAGHVAESGEPVNIPDAYQDERFNCEIDTFTGYHTKALLCMPIKDSSGDVIGVAQVINKINGECFTETDEKVFASYLQFCGIGLRNAQLYEKSQLEIKRNQVLLDLARMIFEEQSTIEHMVLRILTHMQSLIQCQRVQILLVHEASKGSFSRVFDFEANDLSQEDSISRTSPYESRFPINVGITGHVATTGETVNIPNAYEDDRFDPSVDDNSTFKHKSILCMAIKNSLGQIIGVIQLINKFDDLSFTKNDENFVEAFAIFCGMGIHNTHMYEKAIVAMAKQSVTLEVLSYHASATMDEAHRLRRLRVPSAAHFRLHDFKFDDIHFEDDDTLKACLRMFLDLDFVERFHIDYEVLCRWLLSVKKNYRNVTYHNWRHAFNVAQMMFAILTATQWWKIFGEIECLALIIGCLCHDLDHRGTNNSFQIKASSPLAQLYSTSTMEHHHFDQCLMILNSPGNQILANLSSEDYCRVIHVLEDAILSTDLAVYLKKRGPFLQSVKQQPMSYWVDEEPRALLRAMSMTVCDLSAITKPWDIEKRVADLVSSEFFEQGDMEKQELNITPIDIMNREKEDELPTMQVGFIDDLCLPIYEAFAHLSVKLEPLVEGVRDNRQHWIKLAQGVENKSKHFFKTAGCNSSEKSQWKPKVVNKNKLENNIDADAETEADADADVSSNEDEAEEEDVENCEDSVVVGGKKEEEAGIDGDDDDSDVEIHHSNSGISSCSSRLSTPPPTGEDDSAPTSPTKSTQSKLTANNLNCLAQRILKPRRVSCRSACSNRFNDIRKATSLKDTNEIGEPTNCGNSHSKSTPTMSSCGTTGVAHHNSLPHNQSSCVGNHLHQQQHQHRHHHSHNNSQHHNNSNNHHHHHHHQHHHNNTNSGGAASSTASTVSAAESDKIPKIVGKLGNLDTMQLFTCSTTNCNDPLHHHAAAGANGLGLAPNGHINFISGPTITRRHSETNGPMSTIPLSAKTLSSSSPPPGLLSTTNLITTLPQASTKATTPAVVACDK